MIKKLLFILVIFHLILSTNAQNSDTSTTNYKRLLMVAGATSLTVIGPYYYLQNVWWKDQKTDFKIDHDQDYKYARNLDKAGHFFGGVLTAELFDNAFSWAGVPKKKAVWFSAATGFAVQSIIEYKDAFAPGYGFSMGDLGAGTLGSSIPIIQYYVPAARAITFKLSYYKRHDYYYQQFQYAQLIDDYMNQTYWLSVSLNDWLPKNSVAEKIWPDFLTIVGGWGVDETLNYWHTGISLKENKGKGKDEFYLSFDIDWRKIIKQKSTFRRTLAYSLNCIKLPMPTFRFAPTGIFYPVFL